VGKVDIETPARFLLEVVEAVTQVWRGDCVGIKLSPSNTFYGMVDSDPQATLCGQIGIDSGQIKLM
jgi:2,4-dienoyl-CoA reductase-like NADH-dependent reductase (Old Yellow Enzyme family)